MSERMISEDLIRRAPRSRDDLLALLFDGLDWPRPPGMEIKEVPLLGWSPDELHLDPAMVARLTRIQQLPALTAAQPFGVFILTFDGGRLPVGAVRRLVSRLIRKKRAQSVVQRSLWNLHDLIFFCQSAAGVGTLHVVAFRETDNVPVMRVISWDTHATDNRIRLIASENLPDLTWPKDDTFDPDRWRAQWTAAFRSTYRQGIRTAAALATHMAEVAQIVRDEVKELYEVETMQGPLRLLYAEVRQNLRADLTPDQFADMYAQTMVYGLLTARITHPEDFHSATVNAVLTFGTLSSMPCTRASEIKATRPSMLTSSACTIWLSCWGALTSIRCSPTSALTIERMTRSSFSMRSFCNVTTPSNEENSALTTRRSRWLGALSGVSITSSGPILVCLLALPIAPPGPITRLPLVFRSLRD